MENKDAIIGFLLIGIVTVAGWVGFLYVNPITKTKTEEDEETIYIPTQILRDYESGLPDDLSTAPTTSLILYNETGDQVQITMAQIIQYIEKWDETDPDATGNEGKESWWEKRLKPLTVIDSSGVPITGVDITELLRVFDCNFAGELEFVSNDPSIDKLKMDVIDITNTFDNEDDDDNNIILGIAADKKWLRNSPIADDAGDFVLIGQEVTYPEGGNNVTEIVEYKCNDLANISVTKNWTIAINVYNNDDSLNHTLVLDAFNITEAYSGPYHYEYDNTEWWYFNGTYEGTNISQLVDYTKAKGTDYIFNITFSPGDSQPGSKEKRGIFSYADNFNWTDAEEGIANNGTHVIGNHVDYVNWTDGSYPYDVNIPTTGIPMLKSDLLMCLTNKIQYGYSHRGGYYNTPWEKYYNEGYAPFKLIIPSLGQSRFYNGVTGINIKILSDTR